jgi:hypothetical protein
MKSVELFIPRLLTSPISGLHSPNTIPLRCIAQLCDTHCPYLQSGKTYPLYRGTEPQERSAPYKKRKISYPYHESDSHTSVIQAVTLLLYLQIYPNLTKTNMTVSTQLSLHCAVLKACEETVSLT